MLEKVVHTNNGFFVEEFFCKQRFVLKLKKLHRSTLQRRNAKYHGSEELLLNGNPTFNPFGFVNLTRKD